MVLTFVYSNVIIKKIKKGESDMTKQWVDMVFNSMMNKDEARKYCYHTIRSDRCKGLMTAESFITMRDYIKYHK